MSRSLSTLITPISVLARIFGDCIATALVFLFVCLVGFFLTVVVIFCARDPTQGLEHNRQVLKCFTTGYNLCPF
jgi:hypothetical protein